MIWRRRDGQDPIPAHRLLLFDRLRDAAGHRRALPSVMQARLLSEPDAMTPAHSSFIMQLTHQPSSSRPSIRPRSRARYLFFTLRSVNSWLIDPIMNMCQPSVKPPAALTPSSECVEWPVYPSLRSADVVLATISRPPTGASSRCTCTGLANTSSGSAALGCSTSA